jgi:hypothetical protein
MDKITTDNEAIEVYNEILISLQSGMNVANTYLGDNIPLDDAMRELCRYIDSLKTASNELLALDWGLLGQENDRSFEYENKKISETIRRDERKGKQTFEIKTGEKLDEDHDFITIDEYGKTFLIPNDKYSNSDYENQELHCSIRDNLEKITIKLDTFKRIAIDWDNTYPTKDQCENINVSAVVNKQYETLKSGIAMLAEKAPSKKMFIDRMAKKWEDVEAGKKDTDIWGCRFFDNDIDLYSCFMSGWNSADHGTFVVCNGCYKFHPEVKKQIEVKYPKGNFPSNYFQELSNKAVENISEGMLRYLTYVWLKEEALKATIQPPDKEEPSPNEQGAQSKPDKKFTDYIVNCTDEAHKQAIIDFMANKLSLTTHKNVIAARLVVALIGKSYLTKTSVTDNKTEFHRLLSQTFGNIGFLNRFGDVFNRCVNDNGITEKDKKAIQDYINTMP